MSEPRKTRSTFLGVAIVGLGVILAMVLLATGPTTAPDEKPASTTIVRTMTVAPRTEIVTVEALGPVIPARRVTIKPQVSGRVLHYHEALVPGGFIRRGEELVAIDPSDYQLALAESESALEEALFELDLEKGRQVVARREWQLLEEDLLDSEVNQSLVLREPHLRRTEARIRSASNDIARAELALSRTSVVAPFNAMVLDEAVEEGQLVQAGSEIATLVGTDEFWVQATLSVKDLQRIELPTDDHPGANATIQLHAGAAAPVTWRGTVIRLLSDLEPTGRMARVLIRVKDPLGLAGDGSKVPLLLGSYVRAQIDAGTMENVLVIPRQALREGGRIWVVNENNELQIRDTELLWTLRGKQDSYVVSNVIQPGEQLVISGLRTALPGMKVSPQSDAPGAGGKGKGQQKPGDDQTTFRERPEMTPDDRPRGGVAVEDTTETALMRRPPRFVVSPCDPVVVDRFLDPVADEVMRRGGAPWKPQPRVGRVGDSLA